ncbi:MAG: S-formylglutathione hydrolase, partial [Nitrosomonas sp.]|nr:S-formylglutathione hydrolase [Nitrosomonas sp.]
ALTLALRYPSLFRSVSAFAPICAPMQCSWGQKAFHNYLGENQQNWRLYDATALIRDGRHVPDLLIDQGMDDQFLTQQLYPEALEKACREADQKLTLRFHSGYDHSYYFISTFIGEHLKYHRNALL